ATPGSGSSGFASAQDAADAGTEAFLQRNPSTGCTKYEKGDVNGKIVGNAAALVRSIRCIVDASGGPGFALLIYVFKDVTGWHYLDARGTQAPGFLPNVGQQLTLQLNGCANVRSAPSTRAHIETCLGTGSQVA